ncbi:MAG: ATP phosphoribosyltransferase regulatory subunit [Peptococcaceae bacterium]|nr:ATP phosphoribosyltransferase regulatory subunit [Peptococcaceae bacterium]
MLKSYHLITPKGTKDILLEECEAQSWIEEQLRGIFSGYGYCQVVTPGVEYLDVYANQPGNAGSEHMFKLLDNEGRIMVLRPDSTAPIARLAATRLRRSVMPLRLYYNQRVYRQKGLYSGRRIETAQMGAELIGADSTRADLEMLHIAMEVLAGCGFQDYRIELGHGGLCGLLIDGLPADSGQKEGLRQFIREKNYAALNDLLDTLEQSDQTRAIRHLPGLFGGREVLDRAEAVFQEREAREILAYLRSLFDILRRLGLGDRLLLDLGFVNDNDYYTGIIFQGYVQGLGEAALLGGRYDRLLARFGEPWPAIGFGVNVDLLTKRRLEEGWQRPAPPPGALIWGGTGYEALSLQYAKTLRQTPGMTVENSVFADLAQSEAYARAKGIPQLHEVGETIKIHVL